MTDMIDIAAPADQQEGTFSVLKNWLKNPGDRVSKHEPVAELETDKVVLEVSAPADGVMGEYLKELEAEVEPGEVIARLRTGEAATASAKDGPVVETPKQTAPKQRKMIADPERRLSPAVRKLIKEHRVDPSSISGSGRGGRITRQDVVDFVDSGGLPAKPAAAKPDVPKPPSGPIPGKMVEVTTMRKKIAEHMAMSVATAPHVTAVFEMDLSAIIAHRKASKQAFADQGINLTFTAYFVAASAKALQTVPQVNSRYHGDHLELYTDCNIGVGTALGDEGLIVPVIHKAQGLTLMDIAARLQDATERARDGRLRPADVQGGTFSISNHGVSGSLVASPIIINQPQSAILGIGKMEKRVVVEEVAGRDVIAIKPMAFVTLTIDHRVLDGHQTNAFLTKFVDVIQNWA